MWPPWGYAASAPVPIFSRKPLVILPLAQTSPSSSTVLKLCNLADPCTHCCLQHLPPSSRICTPTWGLCFYHSARDQVQEQSQHVGRI
jgi:hypothetical protein